MAMLNNQMVLWWYYMNLHDIIYIYARAELPSGYLA